MNTANICEELTGLFIIRNCESPVTKKCEKCEKKICELHSFETKGMHVHDEKVLKNIAALCISCFVELDSRLTKEVELYSKDRAIWRRKMMERFHREYPYMLFMADDYGSLFDTSSGVFVGGYSDDDDSYFDS